MTTKLPSLQFDADGIPILSAPGPESPASIKRRIEELGRQLAAKWPNGKYCYTAKHRAWAQQHMRELQERIAGANLPPVVAECSQEAA